MAELNTNKKKKPIVTWVIFGVIIVVIAVWLITSLSDEPKLVDVKGEEEEYGTELRQNDTEQIYTEFTSFIEDSAESLDMGIHHHYTSRGIALLSSTLEFLAENIGVNTQNSQNELVQKSNAIEQDPYSTEHAGTIKEAFLSAVDILEELQEERFQNMSRDVGELRQIAESLSDEDLTLDQKEKVKNFFEKSANVVSLMMQRLQGELG